MDDPAEKNEGAFEWVRVADVPELIEKGRIMNSAALVGLLHVLAAGARRRSRAQ